MVTNVAAAVTRAGVFRTVVVFVVGVRCKRLLQNGLTTLLACMTLIRASAAAHELCGKAVVVPNKATKGRRKNMMDEM